MKQLQCLNFQPREEFLDYAQKQIDKLLSQSPSDTTLEAKAFFNDERFVIELGLHSEEGHFRSAVGVPIPTDHPKGRVWQAAALDEVMNDLYHQLRKWKKNRRLPPAA